jgi:hypothetical protein
MEKKGILVVANLGLDPALAMAIIMTNIWQVKGVEAISYGEEMVGLSNYFFQPDCVTESLKMIIDNQELLVLIGYHDEPGLIDLINELKKEMTIIIIGECCSTYLASLIINYQVHADYLQAAVTWCLKKKIELSENILQACKGEKEVSDQIVQRYEKAWSTVYNLNIEDYKKQADFHLDFVDEIVYGEENKRIEKMIKLYKKMGKETRRLRKRVQDLGYSIGFIKASSKPFFIASALSAIKGGYLVKIVEYEKDDKTKHIVCYDQKIRALQISDVIINDGPFKLGVIGQN